MFAIFLCGEIDRINFRNTRLENDIKSSNEQVWNEYGVKSELIAENFALFWMFELDDLQSIVRKMKIFGSSSWKWN